ncbi:hypothetical protein KIN20_033676 [Parelaphostrongylus tenuis]|uniref:Uncharacterized protein n=1 Tax=Parelaphostrongylus tenuis TaxID=148309 RepID=A0AAD5WJ31_PARTN|nr:hypothetical protein KIN20_033676 [Parelaphostrongylus tenuis]
MGRNTLQVSRKTRRKAKGFTIDRDFVAHSDRLQCDDTRPLELIRVDDGWEETEAGIWNDNKVIDDKKNSRNLNDCKKFVVTTENVRKIFERIVSRLEPRRFSAWWATQSPAGEARSNHIQLRKTT